MLKKPDQRELEALFAIDHRLVEWLRGSLGKIQNDLIDAPSDKVARLQGAGDAVRSILNSVSGARDALERIRSQ